MTDPIIDYDQLSKKQRRDINQDRKEYLRAHRKFAKILTSGQWVSAHRDSQVFKGDAITSWETTEGQNWQFAKSGKTQLSAVNTYRSPAYPSDQNIYTNTWSVQVDPNSLTFIARDPKTPDREVEGRYLPKSDTLQLLINGPATSNATAGDSETHWGITTHLYSHII